jgi:mono/diheme cytochrome c family protein
MKFAVVTIALSLVTLPAGADSYEEHDYILNCSGCHRMDGTGSSAVPSLRAMSDLAGRPGAREYWIQVPGAAQAPVSDERLASLLNWLVERFAGTPPEPAYTADEVRRLRGNPLRDPLAKRRELQRLASP